MKAARLFLRLSSVILLLVTIFAPPATADVFNSGQLRREIYTNVFGLGVADLTNSSKFPSSPDIMTTVNFFETPSQFGEQYGQRISGYLLPPVTGNYTFYLAADDQAVLYLSPTTNSADKIPIAHEWYWAFP